MKTKKTEYVYIHRSTVGQLTREAFLATLNYLYQPQSESEKHKLERFSIAMCDIWSDLHDNQSLFYSYTQWLEREGIKPPTNIEQLGALAERIEEHLTAAETLGMNRCD